jgi:hypothetical protein
MLVSTSPRIFTDLHGLIIKFKKSVIICGNLWRNRFENGVKSTPSVST